MKINSRNTDLNLAKAKIVSDRYAIQLLENPGVLGIGVGTNEEDFCIRLFVKKEDFEGKADLPRQLEGIPIILEESEGDWTLNSIGK